MFITKGEEPRTRPKGQLSSASYDFVASREPPHTKEIAHIWTLHWNKWKDSTTATLGCEFKFSLGLYSVCIRVTKAKRRGKAFNCLLPLRVMNVRIHTRSGASKEEQMQKLRLGCVSVPL